VTRARLGLAAIAALVGASCSTSHPAAAPDAGPAPFPMVRDAQGRAIVLRGVNVSNAAKGASDRLPVLADADVKRITVDWGFDFVRLLVFWDAIEPTAGTIDGAYLDAVAQRVAMLGAAGVSVLLDMHQDVYAAKFCCDGAPSWAIVDDGQPFALQSLWSANYLQPAVTRAFDHFWNADGSHPELQDHYASAVKALAARFAGDPNVVGYDLMNEPFPGSQFDLSEALFRSSPEDGGMSAAFDRASLGPFYQRLLGAIREVDPDHYVFFEPRYAAPANGSPSYLPALVDPRAGEPHVVYAPHLYSTAVEANGAYAAGDQTIPSWEAARSAERATLKAPLVLGEWGLAWKNTNAARFVDELLAMADRAGAGWAYWSYDPSGADGWALEDASGNENPIVAHVVRPYPRRVAGDPTAWSWDDGAKALDVAYVDRADASGAHELFVPAARTYAGGWHVEVTPDAPGTWTTAWDAGRGVVSVTVPKTGGAHHVRLLPGGS
jgi:endoglycosylceramidase